MQIEEAQREVRTRLMGGFAGQLVSGALWLASAAVSTWGSRTAGMIVLFAGGFFIFPLTQLLIRLMGRSAKLSPENRLEHLGRQDEQLRSEEHTSELQSRENLVCRLLLEKKKHKPSELRQTHTDC